MNTQRFSELIMPDPLFMQSENEVGIHMKLLKNLMGTPAEAKIPPVTGDGRIESIRQVASTL